MATSCDPGVDVSDRCYWLVVKEQPDLLIFFVSLSDFNQNLYSYEKIKRTDDSLNLFKKYVNMQKLAKVPLFIVFNKIDIYKK